MTIINFNARTYSLSAFILLNLFFGFNASLEATEYRFSGLIDVRVSKTDSVDSYITGGYGKFRYSDGTQLSLAQLALDLTIDWENDFSFHLISNGYIDDENNGLGITESYLKYRSVPNHDGLRYQARLGFMYPKISLENRAVGWSSPYTLSYSTMNSWIGEEVRHVGLEASVSKLGKYSGSKHSYTLSAVLFSGNDPNGSLLSWHGWTQTSRQSFWNEKLIFPNLPALEDGQPLENQAKRSDPFKELDSATGYQITGQWDWSGKSRVLIGYYDNRSDADVVKDGQYTWMTKFSHLAVKWDFDKKITLLMQHMSGSTKMRIANNYDVVSATFKNTFLLLSKKWQRYTFSARAEHFQVEDKDGTIGDNNNEDGNAFTLNTNYQYTKQLFFHLEYNYIDSTRGSRHYVGDLDKELSEKQWQLGLRYYFR